jgi:hypothetical protein
LGNAYARDSEIMMAEAVTRLGKARALRTVMIINCRLSRRSFTPAPVETAGAAQHIGM